MRIIPGREAWTRLIRTPQSRLQASARHHTASTGMRRIAIPALTPRFKFDVGARFFCIGSCFARNVEEFLLLHGYPVDSLMIGFPKSEWKHRPNGLLNKFTTMSMANELAWAVGDRPNPEAVLLETSDGCLDTQLTRGQALVTKSRAIDRRAGVHTYFGRIRDAEVVVITLGLVEAWYDRDTALYLNMAPPPWAIRRFATRFELHVTSVAENVASLRQTLGLIHDFAPSARVVITVSPVPMTESFTGQDITSANCYSKSVLRATAGEVTHQYDFVDYFPSFDILQFASGEPVFDEDQVHVRDDIVGNIVSDFLRSYSSGSGIPRYPIDDQLYYEANPEAKEMVAEGRCASALDHWQRYGRSQKASLVPHRIANVSTGNTEA